MDSVGLSLLFQRERYVELQYFFIRFSFDKENHLNKELYYLQRVKYGRGQKEDSILEHQYLLAKSIITLEVLSLLLVGVLLYEAQPSPLRCLSFYDLLKGTDCLLLTKLLF